MLTYAAKCIQMYVMSSCSVKIYNVPKAAQVVNESVRLNDWDEHNKRELVLGLFLKVPTAPR